MLKLFECMFEVSADLQKLCQKKHFRFSDRKQTNYKFADWQVLQIFRYRKLLERREVLQQLSDSLL